MLPAQPGSLIAAVSPSQYPPVEAPNPVLRESDVIEPPLPSALAPRITDGPTVTVAAPPPNGQPKINAECFFLTNLALLVIIAILMML